MTGPDRTGPGDRATADQTTDAADADRDAPAAVRRVRLTPASAIGMRRASWLWDGRIPAGALTVIPGREGIGKSLILAWLAAQITRGLLPGLHEGDPRPVVYAASEDSWSHTIAPRLFAAGADLDMVYRVDVEQDGVIGQLTLPRDCWALAGEVTALGAALLAADPLLSVIHSSIDTHRDRDLRTALEPLVALADTTGCAVVGLAHFNKSDSSDALNLITGSRAFSAVARAVVAIARDTDSDDGSCVLSQAKNNLGRLDLPSLRYVIDSAEVPTPDGPACVGRLRFTGESDRSVTDILVGDSSTLGESRSDRDAAAAWLTDYLTQSGGQAPWAEIRKAARSEAIADRTLQRACSRAGVTSIRIGFPSRTVWRLDNEPQSRQSRHSRQLPGGDTTGRDGVATAVADTRPALALAPVAPPTPTPARTPQPGATGATGATGTGEPPSPLFRPTDHRGTAS